MLKRKEKNNQNQPLQEKKVSLKSMVSYSLPHQWLNSFLITFFLKRHFGIEFMLSWLLKILTPGLSWGDKIREQQF
jgi:hypothetical protein